MGQQSQTAAVAPGTPQALLRLRLYIAGEAPNSRRAQANLQAICERYFPGRHEVEVVDVLEDPWRALADGVLVTPALIKLAPEPRCHFVGDLSAHATVLLELGINEALHGV